MEELQPLSDGIRGFALIDAESRFTLICAYTGKEVV
jgi:hypothetical protein